MSQARGRSKFRPWVLDKTITCPECGAKAVAGGEVTFRRRGGRKWYGPWVQFDCGLFIVMPGAGTKAAVPPEKWCVCSHRSGNGKPMVDIPESDYEIREGKEPEPQVFGGVVFKFNGYIFTSSSTSTF